jgi:hypothetical protein
MTETSPQGNEGGMASVEIKPIMAMSFSSSALAVFVIDQETCADLQGLRAGLRSHWVLARSGSEGLYF